SPGSLPAGSRSTAFRKRSRISSRRRPTARSWSSPAGEAERRTRRGPDPNPSRYPVLAVDFTLTDEQRELRRATRDLAEKEFRPRAARWDENEEFPTENLEILARQALLGLAVPEKYGGLGLGDIESALVLEQIARVCLSTAVVCQLFLNGPPRAIAAFGSEDLKERFLPRVSAGECLIGIGMTEPDAGSAAMEMRARLRRTDEGWRLDAYKNMVTGGHRA